MASDKLPQSPPGEHCHSHTLHLTLQPSQLLLSFFLESACEKSLQDFVVLTIFTYSCVSHSVSFGFLNVLLNSLYTPDCRAEHLIIYTPVCYGDASVVRIWIIKDLKCLHHLRIPCVLLNSHTAFE